MTNLAEANQAIAALYENLGQQIRSAREVRGLSQQEVANVIGLMRSSVANIEGGRQRITVHSMIAVCQALDLDPADVVTRAMEGAEPFTSAIPAEVKNSTEKLRKSLLSAQANITKILEALPDKKGK